jgi:hypothetical protein
MAVGVLAAAPEFTRQVYDGVIGHPVAKTAVVAKAVSPRPSPVAKTAVVARGRHTWAGPPPANLV